MNAGPSRDESAGTPRDTLAGIAPALDELLAAADAPVTARGIWLQTWLDCNRDFEPLVITAEEHEKPVGVAVLAQRRHRGWIEVVAAGDGPSDRIVLPARDPAAAERLAEAVAHALTGVGRAWTLALAQLPAGDPVALTLAGRLPVSTAVAGVRSPVLRLGADRSIEAYTSRSYRQNVRTMRNRIERERLTSVLTTTRDPDEIRRLALETESVRLARDRDESRPSMLRLSRHRDFRRMILERLAQLGGVEITTLRVDGTLAAYAVVLLDGRVHRLWDTAFAPEWKRFGAGHLVVSEALERALADTGCDELDFMRGMEDYKLRLATTVKESIDLLAWSSPRTRALTHFASSWQTAAYYRWLARWATRRVREWRG